MRQRLPLILVLMLALLLSSCNGNTTIAPRQLFVPTALPLTTAPVSVTVTDGSQAVQLTAPGSRPGQRGGPPAFSISIPPQSSPAMMDGRGI